MSHTSPAAADPATDFTPFGEGQLDQILDLIKELGDDAESVGLEVKSWLDLAQKESQAKVAKCILGMANRSPEDAARHFRGYGVMAIGAEKDAVRGIERVPEEHEVKGQLRKYLGPTPPRWTLSRRPAPEGRVCLFVVIEPPKQGDPVYLCHGEFQGKDRSDNLRDGAIYLRDSTQTREARAAEVQALIARATTTAVPEANVDIAITGTANRIDQADAFLEAAIHVDAEWLRKERPAPGPVQPWLASMYPYPPKPSSEKRPLTDVLAEREVIARQRFPECLGNLAAATAGRIQLTIANQASGFLTGPEITITLPGVRCLEQLDPDQVDVEDVMPSPPAPKSWQDQLKLASRIPPMNRGDCPLDFSNLPDSCRLTLKPTTLPPRTPRTPSYPDSLVLLVDDPGTNEINATWTLVSPDLPDIVTGSLTIPVIPVTAFELYDRYAEARGLTQSS